eukprot:3071657-Lingulodinium_polyedra.AAC.1
MTAQSMYNVYRSAMPWLQNGYAMAVDKEWLFDGCTMGTQWLYNGRAMAVNMGIPRQCDGCTMDLDRPRRDVVIQ